MAFWTSCQYINHQAIEMTKISRLRVRSVSRSLDLSHDVNNHEDNPPPAERLQSRSSSQLTRLPRPDILPLSRKPTSSRFKAHKCAFSPPWELWPATDRLSLVVTRQPRLDFFTQTEKPFAVQVSVRAPAQAFRRKWATVPRWELGEGVF